MWIRTEGRLPSGSYNKERERAADPRADKVLPIVYAEVAKCRISDK